MAKLTSGFGVLLLAVGIMGYIWTHDLHPAFFGVVLIVCGVLADSESVRRRMIWMHIAVLIGFAGFAIPGTMAARNIVHARRVGGEIYWPQMQHLQEVVSVLCLIYVLICIASFIAARRTRSAGKPVEA